MEKANVYETDAEIVWTTDEVASWLVDLMRDLQKPEEPDSVAPNLGQVGVTIPTLERTRRAFVRKGMLWAKHLPTKVALSKPHEQAPQPATNTLTILHSDSFAVFKRTGKTLADLVQSELEDIFCQVISADQKKETYPIGDMSTTMLTTRIRTGETSVQQRVAHDSIESSLLTHAQKLSHTNNNICVIIGVAAALEHIANLIPINKLNPDDVSSIVFFDPLAKRFYRVVTTS